jgi:hypothetical protein
MDLGVALMTFWSQGEQRFDVGGARAACPVRGIDVDVQECAACGKLLRVVVDDDPPYFVCTEWPPVRVTRGLASNRPEIVIRSTYCSSGAGPRERRQPERHRDE